MKRRIISLIIYVIILVLDIMLVAYDIYLDGKLDWAVWEVGIGVFAIILILLVVLPKLLHDKKREKDAYIDEEFDRLKKK